MGKFISGRDIANLTNKKTKLPNQPTNLSQLYFSINMCCKADLQLPQSMVRQQCSTTTQKRDYTRKPYGDRGKTSEN